MSRCSRLDQGKAVTMRSPEQVPVVGVVAVQHLARNFPSTVERSDSFLHRRVGRVGIEDSMCRLGRSYQCLRDTICGLLFLVICLHEGSGFLDFGFFDAGSCSQFFQAGTCKLPWTHEVHLFQPLLFSKLLPENTHHLIPSDGFEFVIQLHQQGVTFELLLVVLEFLRVDALLDCAHRLVNAALHLSYFFCVGKLFFLLSPVSSLCTSQPKRPSNASCLYQNRGLFPSSGLPFPRQGQLKSWWHSSRPLWLKS